MREIAKRENVSVTDEDLDSEIDDIVSGAPQEAEMRQAYGSNAYLRSSLRNDLYDQRLTDRLIEIATEGKGAVINGYVAETPDEIEPIEASEPEEESSSSTESEVEAENA